MRRNIPAAGLLVLCAATFAGCARPAATPSADAPSAASAANPQKPVDSVVGLMVTQVSPSATALWNAVSTEVGPKGPVEKVPRTDDDWAAVRRQALQLIEASNLLMVPGRATAWPNEKRANPPGPTDLPPAEADARMKQEWPAFLAFSQALQVRGEEALKAIDSRNVDALMEAGGNIDEACEACHKQFWYPTLKKAPGTPAK